jgi:hypothetical protein
MSARIGGFGFLLGSLLSAAVVYVLSAGVWGDTSEYVVASKGTKMVAADDRIVTLYVATRTGRPRSDFEVPRAAYDAATTDDVIHVESRRIPLLNGERLTYSVLHGNDVRHAWTEGKPFYYGSLAVAGAVLGLGVTLLLGFIAAVLRVKAPSE